ncbi:copper fist DNA binding domain-containing protein [Hirsutella rhossiliensis]|uniref:Copper fist DNA binding domain-containing protein n=1 Tax=Hirsutella rhossiliensis TaxID=111463 RepID=A0A9P8MUV2_9HYPO|nr:copper fist DNA binding domain-containing protein [Hirsutella rhossiliensis]KAH0961660.1 copper fist DNA binding domain-containing protein [Hirsutella rhossiliensis]
MPLINGQKMACEPCIRGHRSTKCTHASERLMVPVRKPGRPLSSCPHPSSRTCSCAAVTAAIPRKQKCHCGTSQPAPSDDTASASSSADVSPPSPPKTTFRVQKQSSKSAPSRKQSVDLAGLGRMDASQLNILPAYNGSVSNGAHMPPMADMSLYGLGLTPVDSSFSPESTMFPIFPYPMQSPMMTPSSAKPMANGHAKSSTNGSISGRTPSTPGGCCGGGANGAQAKASCCSAKTDPHEHRPLADSLPGPGIVQQPNGVMMSPFQAPMAMPNGMYPYFSQPTIFNYPPQFGSFLQPLQPEQWKQFMATMSFAQPVPPTAFGMAGPGPYRASSAANLPGTPGGTSWTSHQCSCGDSCQCVGCAAHPYNEATQNYVRSAWSTVTEDGQKTRAEANGAAIHVNGHVNSNHEQQTTNEATTPTPSDGTSGISEEQTLSANDFFFVSYPFGESCAGDTASCPCGDDCQCIGCVIHNNPGPDETPGVSTPL